MITRPTNTAKWESTHKFILYEHFWLVLVCIRIKPVTTFPVSGECTKMKLVVVHSDCMYTFGLHINKKLSYSPRNKQLYPQKLGKTRISNPLQPFLLLFNIIWIPLRFLNNQMILIIGGKSVSKKVKSYLSSPTGTNQVLPFNISRGFFPVQVK